MNLINGQGFQFETCRICRDRGKMIEKFVLPNDERHKDYDVIFKK